MKKIFAAILAMSLALVGLTSCQKEETNVLEQIKERGKLIVVTEPGFVPMEYIAGGEVVGVDIDLVNAIAEKIGVEVEILTVEFTAVIPSVQNGSADLAAAGLSYSEERAGEMDLSEWYFESNQVILAKEGRTDLVEEASLAGKKVAVQMGTTGDFIASDVEGCEVTRLAKYAQCVEELKSGRVDAIVVDEQTATGFMSANPGLEITAKLQPEKTVMGVQKGQEELLAIVNEVLIEKRDSGEVKELVEKHLKQVEDMSK